MGAVLTFILGYIIGSVVLFIAIALGSMLKDKDEQ